MEATEQRLETARTVNATRKQRIEAGKQLRAAVPYDAHAEWIPSPDRPDVVSLLEASNAGRMQELIPIRYGRMLRSPFTFLRGSAGVMASDLARTPSTGLIVQACGDCHLLNFGLFATPERNLVFDINDFDETFPAPWEWDVKRLAASFAVAARDRGFPAEVGLRYAATCVRAYRMKLREYSHLSPLDVWYARWDMETLIETAPDEESRQLRKLLAKKARQRIVDHLFPRIAAQTDGGYRFVDQPPLVYHAEPVSRADTFTEGFEAYLASLSEERRVLLSRYEWQDTAIKVVGIGSVGTMCAVALFVSGEGHPLILQVKEALHSVLEPYAGQAEYEHQGQRVVVGQRLMQSSSDIFLGWAHTRAGHTVYVRQLRDMKLSIPVEDASPIHLWRYAEVCGWTLARAHAKAGDAAVISGYLGKSGEFDKAIARFAAAYADQTERDHAVLREAELSGRIEALREGEM